MAEKFTLTPQQVANLDPFGARRARASEGLKDLLESTKQRQPTNPEPSTDWQDLVKAEEETWSQILGSTTEITLPVPREVTPEVKDRLEAEGFSLVFVPSLDLSPDELKNKDTEAYLKDLAKQYPNWKPFEDLSDDEENDPKVTRNLEQFFWDQVKEGNVDMPTLPGRWLAVETLEKPNWNDTYETTPFSERLGFENRFSLSYDEVNEAIDRTKNDFSTEVGLQEADVRFLDAMEWNLLANRFGWGGSNSYEWTTTEYRGSGGSRRLVVGYSGHGGAARVRWGRPGGRYGHIGFRVAVVFET